MFSCCLGTDPWARPFPQSATSAYRFCLTKFNLFNAVQIGVRCQEKNARETLVASCLLRRPMPTDALLFVRGSVRFHGTGEKKSDRRTTVHRPSLRIQIRCLPHLHSRWASTFCSTRCRIPDETSPWAHGLARADRSYRRLLPPLFPAGLSNEIQSNPMDSFQDSNAIAKNEKTHSLLLEY